MPWRAWRRSSSAPDDLLPDVRGLAGDSASLSAAPAAWRAQRGRCFCCAPCAQGTCPTPVLAPQRARPRRGAPTAPRGGSGCPNDHYAHLEFRGCHNFRMGRCPSRGTGHRPDSALSAALGAMLPRSQVPLCLRRRTQANQYDSRRAVPRQVRARAPRRRPGPSRAWGGYQRRALEANARLAPVCVNELIAQVILAMYYYRLVRRSPPHHAQQLPEAREHGSACRREGRIWPMSSSARRAPSLPKVVVPPRFTLRAVVPVADRASSGRRPRATPRPSALGGQTRPRACALRPERAARAAPAPRAQHLRERRPARWGAG